MSDERLREDELVSAYLDGEATPAEIAEIEASDALLARVEELRAVRDALAEPVVPLSAEQRDDLIGAALGVADAEDAARLDAKVVALQRPQRLLLAMAAAVIVLAAVVGTGLIASRGGDDYDETAASMDTAAPTAEAAAGMAEEPADAAPAAEEEPMPEMDMETADEAMAEEFMAEEEPAAEAALDMAAAEAQTQAMAEEAEAMADELARLAADEAEAALAEDAAAAPTTTVAATTTAAAEADDSDDSPAEQVVDLGTQESLESLFEDTAATWSAALEDGAMADSGVCAAAVQEQALELSAETVRSFVAKVDNEDPVTIDAGFVRRDDGTAVIVYAAPPNCDIKVHELPDP